MALLDLSLVTRALVKLIQVSVSSSEVWNGPGAGIDAWESVPVSPIPADLILAETTSPTSAELSVNLYHVAEDAHFKNQAFPGPETAPVRYTPMGLNLHYQLCVLGGRDHQYQAQLLMGIAVKALHDYPSLTDETEIAGETIFEDIDDLANNENRIRLSLQPIPHNEAVSFWTAGSTPPRLSAYYLASVVLLEPQQPPRRAARVLTYGTYPTAMGVPRLYGSENTLTIEPPGAPQPLELRLRPAEVPLGGPENGVTFTGVGLVGDEVELLLRSLRWLDPHPVDPAWGLVASENRVLAAVQPRVGTEVVLPGAYAASVRVVSLRTLPDGQVRRFTQTSNETPFTITPYIESVEEPDADGSFEIRGTLFQYMEADPDGNEVDVLAGENVQVFTGAERLQRVTNGGGITIESGEFYVASASELQIRLPDGLVSGQHYPLRVMVSGAESAPRWIQVP